SAHELISTDDFRDFMFTNAVRFWGEVNPDFFKGTAVEKQAAETLARPASVAAVREGGAGPRRALEVAARGPRPSGRRAGRVHAVALRLDGPHQLDLAGRTVQSVGARSRARRPLRGARAGWAARQRARPRRLSGRDPQDRRARHQ